jgi:5-hydroxyisourate hydrolase
MAGITTHVLDTALGRPAAGVAITLEVADGPAAWRQLGAGVTDADGRLRTLVPADATIDAGTYRLTFDTGAYFTAAGRASFYPSVQVTFQITAPAEHHHVPLLLSPYGYSTYRGS